PEGSAAVIDDEGWLHTGDQARIEDGFIYITGRLKDVIVLTNGEKVSPADMEMAIAMDPLFDQVLLLGEGRPYLTALVVPNQDVWREVARVEYPDEPDIAVTDPRCADLLLRRIDAALRDFPGYAKVREVGVCEEPWTVANGLLTPTMKPRRERIVEHYAADIARLYARR
ncbi:MAG TPA: long-chain fatty acid--CoA ligase, partial [Alphaproteobacteria bacterium]|nr:long-chain fatty acid--CoA ligase [Alphaproteobacteria bacterium]